MEIGTGFALSTPIPPGEFNILVSFLLAYDGDGFEFPLILPFGADHVRFMLPHAESTITGEGLGPPRTTTVNDRVFTVVEGIGFERGTRLTVTVSGLPNPSFVERAVDYFGGRAYIPILAWLAGTAFLSLLAYALIRARNRPATEAPTRRELVNAIAALDELRDAGKIEPKTYTVEREALMRRALRAPEDGEPSMKDETGASATGMTQRRAIIIGLGIPVGFLVAILIWGTLQTGGEQGRPGVNSSFGDVAVSTDPHSDFVLPSTRWRRDQPGRSAREDRGGGLLGVVVPTVQGRGAGVGRGVPGLAGTRGGVRGDRAMGRRTSPSANSLRRKRHRIPHRNRRKGPHRGRFWR